MQELVGSSVKILPALLAALIVILITRFIAEFVQGIATIVGRKTIRSQSLQLLLSKTAYVTTWLIGILIASVIAFPSLRLG
ncbi:MAG: mechanosensitive ion channel family protein, partial [Spirulinaceae cyanobacterium]